jgi:hypothetical protein
VTAGAGAAIAGKSTRETIGFDACGISAAANESAGLAGLIGINIEMIGSITDAAPAAVSFGCSDCSLHAAK